MTVQVHIPPVLRGIVNGRRRLEAQGETIQSVLQDIARQYPAIALHLFDENGAVRRNVLCIHNATAIRPRDFALRNIASSDEIVLTNALAGG